MNVKSIIIIITIFFKENVIYCKFFPSIASHPGFEIMYNTESGWVQHNYTLKNQTNGSEVLELCKKLYPKNNIKFVMKMFETELITNWSHKAINSNKTTNSSFDVHLFRCFDAPYNIQLNIPGKCGIHFDSDKSCQSFDHWKSISMKNCTSKLSYLYNMQQTYASESCQDVPMHFNQNEYICCPADIGYYENLLNNYTKNGHKERSSFSKLRHVLSLVYKVKLNECNLRLNKRMESLILNSKHDRNYYENGLKLLKKEFKSQYVNISEWYSDQFLKIEKTHIKRTIEKIKHQCSNSNEKTQVPNKCIKLMNSITDQLKYHHERISSVNSSYVYELNSFLIKQFEILKKNYSLGLNKSITNDLSKKLDEAVEYLTPKNNSLTIYDIFENEFKKCISKYQTSMEFNPKVKHSHNTPIISIVVTTVILLSLIVLTFIATLVIKCCGQPFRRSSPNYVMSVVFNANQNQGPMHRLDQQISSNANRQDVKLNLYENPIFNAKSVGKPIEKQSLIENMES